MAGTSSSGANAGSCGSSARTCFSWQALDCVFVACVFAGRRSGVGVGESVLGAVAGHIGPFRVLRESPMADLGWGAQCRGRIVVGVTVGFHIFYRNFRHRLVAYHLVCADICLVLRARFKLHQVGISRRCPQASLAGGTTWSSTSNIWLNIGSWRRGTD